MRSYSLPVDNVLRIPDPELQQAFGHVTTTHPKGRDDALPSIRTDYWGGIQQIGKDSPYRVMKKQDPVLRSDSSWRMVVQPENGPAKRPLQVSLQMHQSDILRGHDVQITRKDTETIVQEKEGDKTFGVGRFYKYRNPNKSYYSAKHISYRSTRG